MAVPHQQVVRLLPAAFFLLFLVVWGLDISEMPSFTAFLSLLEFAEAP
jgi:Na+-transporting NADH:ubiquinone oxidoreductase subunit NqrD